MKSHPERKYDSPLRRAQTQDTRERLLAAVADILASSRDGGFVLDDVARAAGVERRTMFRHFPSREALFESFWHWINARIAPAVLPRTRQDLTSMPVSAFKGFDAHEGIIRASLHTPSGRQMRLSALDERKRAFAEAVRHALPDASPADLKRTEAIVHVLYSAATWETLRDYCDLDGAEAGETVAWAIERLIGTLQGSASAQTNPNGDHQP